MFCIGNCKSAAKHANRSKVHRANIEPVSFKLLFFVVDGPYVDNHLQSAFNEWHHTDFARHISLFFVFYVVEVQSDNSIQCHAFFI